MKKLLAASCLLALSSPLHAAANRVHDVSFQIQAQDAVIAVAADGAFERPRVRSERGRLRVWFPGMTDRGRLTIEGDGAAIGQIALRPSGSKTALLEIELHSDKALPKKAIRAQAEGDRFYLRIARSALPELSLDGDGEDIPVGSADAETPTALGDGTAAEPSPATDLAEDLGLQRTEHPATALGAAQPLSEIATARGPMHGGEGQSSTTLWVMVALAGALGGGYLYVRKAKPKLGDDANAEIELLGSRRIGPRQQLLLIRALGENHLIFLNGDKAEHLAAVRPAGERAVTEPLAASPASPPREARSPRVAPAHERTAEDDADFGELLAAAATRDDPVSVDHEQSAQGRTKSSFERDVMGLMRRMSGSQDERSTQAECSPAVQGLLRLRREVG